MYDCIKFHTYIDKHINNKGINCNFHIEKQTSIKSPKFIACTCLFKMKTSYRNFNIYLNQLKETCENNKTSSIIIRIYYDDTVENDIGIFKKYNNVELIQYDFPDIVERGTFGTFMRYLPLFTNESYYYTCFDADMLLNHKEILNCISVMKKYSSFYYGLFYDCVIDEYINRIGTDKILNPIMATYICLPSKLKLNITILTDFLKLIINKDEIIVKWVEKNKKSRSNDQEKSLFRYGIDEFFINSYILPNILKKTSIIGTRLYMNIRKLHYELYKSIIEDNKNIDISSLNNIFKKYIKQQNDSKKLITEIDNIINKKLTIYKTLNSDIEIYFNYVKFLSNISQNIFSENQKKCLKNHSSSNYVDEYYVLEPKHQKGGNTDHNILIIVPFADFRPEQKRSEQLKQYISHMEQLISNYNTSNTHNNTSNTDNNTKINIVIAEQISPLKYFNRGQLLNAGIKWYISKNKNPDFVITHDVDMLPDKVLFNEYLIAKKPISLVPQDEEYKKKYGRVILSAGGGIFGLPFQDYIKANGYPNDLWNWGGEDDAFSKRLDNINSKKFTRVKNGHIKHIDIQRESHQSKMEYLRKNKIRSMTVHENLNKDNKNWKNNGINQLKLNVKEFTKNNCIYHIKCELDESGLKESIEHNEKVYKELYGDK